MLETSSSLGFVVGAGSIGRRHVQKLATRCTEIIVVDPSLDARKWVEENLAVPTKTFESLEVALGELDADLDSAIAVIANWGPDHPRTFRRLVDAGFRRILCEKPLANSPRAGWEMAKLAEREGVLLTFGMYMRYAGLDSFIKSQLNEHAGGGPVMLAVHGGAQCLVTNGIHYFDLACALFGEGPVSVTAEAKDGRINPRSPELGFWEGTAVWNFTEGRSATVTLSNSSSVSSSMHVYGPTGRLDLSPSLELPLAVGSRDPSEIARDGRVTRTGELVKQTLHKRGFVPEQDTTERQFDELQGAVPLSYPAGEAATVMEAVLATLASAAQGRRIDLPLAQDDPVYDMSWPVS